MKKYKVVRTFTYEGKRYYCYGDTEEEVAEKIKKKKKKVQQEAGYRENRRRNMTVEQWAKIAVPAYKSNQSEETSISYNIRMKKCILDVIGRKKMHSIRPVDLQNVLNRQTGKSKTQVNEVYGQLKFLFLTAQQNGIIENNPASNLMKPYARKKTRRRALTPTERAYIKKVSLSDRKFYVFALMLLCGCRPAEAGECKGADIQGKMLHIRGTKTEAADRYVPIPDVLYEVIKDTPLDEYISCTNKQQKIDGHRRIKIWSSFTRAVNIAMGCKTKHNALVPPLPLADDLVPYCLRHEYCTQLARLGIDIRIAQKLMGHANISMTANIYTNLDKEDTDIEELHRLI